jgi:hypothetical protein
MVARSDLRLADGPLPCTMRRMATRGLRASVRMRAYRDVLDRRQRIVLATLLLGASVSAAALGSAAFASHAAPLAESVSDATPPPEEAIGNLAAVAEQDQKIRQEQRKVAEPPPAPEVAASTVEQTAIDDAIRALHDDGIPRNAMDAVRVLCDFGNKAVPALQRALDSSDEQQRHLAAFVLRWIDSKPSRRLCELSIEALGDPEIEGYFRTLIHRPALSATRWLDAHAQSKEVVPHLLAAARSEHAQRRFLAAALLARAGVQRDLPHTCSVLLAQLPDNSRLGDALVAAHALYKLGPAALPQIKLAYRGADDQARSLLQLVEESLADDAAGITRTEAELLERYQRLGLRNVTDARLDPARGHPFLGVAVLPRL